MIFDTQGQKVAQFRESLKDNILAMSEFSFDFYTINVPIRFIHEILK